MNNSKKIIILSGLAVAIVLFPGKVEAKAIKGYTDTNYARIYFSDIEDVYTYTQNIGQGWKFLTESPKKDTSLIKKRTDEIIENVGKRKNIDISGFKVNIYLVDNLGVLRQEFIKHGGDPFGKIVHAFYGVVDNAIYVSINDIASDILAHEVSHAIDIFKYGVSSEDTAYALMRFF